MKTKTEEVIFVHHSQLEHHPQNMRRIYRREDVEQMAASIAERGIIQPLIGMISSNGNGGPPTYIVTCGNLRLAGTRLLGDAAPLVPLIVRPREEAEALLDMAAENLIRTDIDPVSEALHYRRLLAQPGMTQQRLAREIGISSATVADRLLLLELEPEIQDLVASGELPRTRPPVEAILSIPDRQARVRTAQALASRRADTRLIKATCTRVREKVVHSQSIQQADREGREHVPPLAAALEEGLPPADGAAVDWEDVRQAVDDACEKCTLAEEYEIPIKHEPGWTLIYQNLAESAEGHCAACSVRDYAHICGQCPMVEFFQRLTRRVNKERRNGNGNGR